MIRLMSALLALVVLMAPIGAQGRPADTSDIPTTQRPPAGMCRIWIDGVPAERQPAPTDCATAIRRRPPNARVIFGDENRAHRPGLREDPSSSGDQPPVRDLHPQVPDATAPLPGVTHLVPDTPPQPPPPPERLPHREKEAHPQPHPSAPPAHPEKGSERVRRTVPPSPPPFRLKTSGRRP